MSSTVEIHRFDETEGRSDLFFDNALGFVRTNFPRVGPNSGWVDPEKRGPIEATEFVVGMMMLPPGGEAASHRHHTTEVFMVLGDAPLTVYWGDSSEHEVELGKWDVISIPADVWRGVRNDGQTDAFILGVAGGADGGGVEFHPEIVALAAGAQAGSA